MIEKEFPDDLLAENLRHIDDLCKELGRKASMRITVILPDGRVAGDTDESPQNMANHADRPEIAEALAGNVGRSASRWSDTLKEWRLYAAVPVRARRQNHRRPADFRLDRLYRPRSKRRSLPHCRTAW